MTLSPLGKQYICKNFGDTSLCCVKTGLSWYYTESGIDYHETGGTAQIVFRLASGWINSLTMTNPARGTFTKAELDAANESVVDPKTDPLEITNHDEPTEVQWCFIPCEDHPDKTTCVDVYRCYWWNNTCHTILPSCGELNNQPDCEQYGCYWYNNSCHAEMICENINNQVECEGYGCFWYNGSCHSTVACEDITTQIECEGHGCYWYNGSCHTNVPSCPELNNHIDCERFGCYWWNDTCHAITPDCSELNNIQDCQIYGCYWYRNLCHSVDQPELCYWIDDRGGPNAIGIADVFTIADAWLLNTPPAGYTFIPTIQNVFGVADYWMGFIESGNSNTGCLYVG